jgi:DnaJ domain
MRADRPRVDERRLRFRVKGAATLAPAIVLRCGEQHTRADAVRARRSPEEETSTQTRHAVGDALQALLLRPGRDVAVSNDRCQMTRATDRANKARGPLARSRSRTAPRSRNSAIEPLIRRLPRVPSPSNIRPQSQAGAADPVAERRVSAESDGERRPGGGQPRPRQRADGGAESAAQRLVGHAYRARCKEIHPDLHDGSRGATEEMMRLNQAWEILRSPAMREAYDWVQTQRNQTPA